MPRDASGKWQWTSGAYAAPGQVIRSKEQHNDILYDIKIELDRIKAFEDDVANSIRWRGEWQAGVQYKRFDAVHHDHESYITLSSHTSTAATEPGVGADWETVWTPISDVRNTSGTVSYSTFLPDVANPSPAQQRQALLDAAAEAKSNGATLMVDRDIVLDQPVELPDGVQYDFQGHSIDLRQTPVPNDPYVSYYNEPGVSITSGSVGSYTPVQSNAKPPRLVHAKTATQSGGTATMETYTPHGLSVGDWVWVFYPGGWHQYLEDDGAFYYLSQLNSSKEMLAFGLPKQITAVPDATHFEFAVDPAAPSPLNAAYNYFVAPVSNAVKLADVSGWQPGDYAMLTSDRNIPVASGTQTIKVAQAFRVERIDPSGWLVFSGNVDHEYLTSENARVAKIAYSKPTEIRNLTVIGRGASGITTPSYGAGSSPIDAAGDIGLQAHLCEHVRLENIQVIDCERLGIDVQRCYSAHLEGIRIKLSTSNDGGRQTGNCPLTYAINYGGAMNQIVIRDVVSEGNTRHHITESTYGWWPGFTRQVVIENVFCRGGLSNAITTHYPNRGYAVRNVWAELSGNASAIESRAGNLQAENIEAIGGTYAVNAYGLVEDINLKNIRARGCMAGVYLNPFDTVGQTHRNIAVEDLNTQDCERSIHVYDATAQQLVAKFRNIVAENCGAEPIKVEKPNGDAWIEIHGLDVHGGGSTYAAYFPDADTKGTLRDVKAWPPRQYLLPMDQAARFEMHGNIVGFDLTVPVVEISGGAITIQRGDDHTILLRGEGQTADVLTHIHGLRHGQTITLQRYSETITLKDSSGSGGIQTPNSADVVIDSVYRVVRVFGASSGGAIYPVVVEVNTA